MSSKSLAEVANYRPLSACGIEELAAHQINATPSPGVLFARKQEHEEKDAARLAILDLLGPDEFPKGLSVLSMPSVQWKFERKLFGRREGDWLRKKGPHRTYLTCIENDRPIYHAALMQMPGVYQLKHGNSIVQMLPATSFAERVVRNRWVGRFFFANVDDLMRDHDGEHQYDVAWLDYTGPLTIERLALIDEFFRKGVRSILVVTALKARWNRDTSDAIERAGGHSAWFLKTIPGALLHEINYQDGGSPMAQFAMRKTEAA